MVLPFPAFAPSIEHTKRYTGRKGRRTRAASHRRELPIPPPDTLIRPLDGEWPGLKAAPTEQNTLRATRRLIARIKCEVCGGVEMAAARDGPGGRTTGAEAAHGESHPEAGQGELAQPGVPNMTDDLSRRLAEQILRGVKDLHEAQPE